MTWTMWTGTADERRKLLDAVQHNCNKDEPGSCQYTAEGNLLRQCTLHDALSHSARFVNGLLFMHRNRLHLWAEETQPFESNLEPPREDSWITEYWSPALWRVRSSEVSLEPSSAGQSDSPAEPPTEQQSQESLICDQMLDEYD